VYNDPFKFNLYSDLMKTDVDLAQMKFDFSMVKYKVPNNIKFEYIKDFTNLVFCGHYAANKLFEMKLPISLYELAVQKVSDLDYLKELGYEMAEFKMRVGILEISRVTIDEKKNKVRVANALVLNPIAPAYILKDNQKFAFPPLLLLSFYIDFWLSCIRLKTNNSAIYLLSRFYDEIRAIEKIISSRLDSDPNFFLHHDSTAGTHVDRKRQQQIEKWENKETQ
jgi:hypothetical protein